MPIAFYAEGNTPIRDDPSRVIEMKILGATRDATPGSSATDYATGGNFSGAGSPEGVVLASPGAVYVDTNPPGALYFKLSGVATDTGWV